MNFNLDTRDGMNNAVLWTAKMFETLKDGGSWVIPRSATIVTVNHKTKTAHIAVGYAPDPSIEKVIKAMGWNVVVFNN